MGCSVRCPSSLQLPWTVSFINDAMLLLVLRILGRSNQLSIALLYSITAPLIMSTLPTSVLVLIRKITERFVTHLGFSATDSDLSHGRSWMRRQADPCSPDD